VRRSKHQQEIVLKYSEVRFCAFFKFRIIAKLQITSNTNQPTVLRCVALASIEMIVLGYAFDFSSILNNSYLATAWTFAVVMLDDDANPYPLRVLREIMARRHIIDALTEKHDIAAYFGNLATHLDILVP